MAATQWQTHKTTTSWSKWWVSPLFRNPKGTTGLAILALFIFVALAAPLLTHDRPNATIYRPLQPPSWHHLLGTSGTGQDVWAQLVYGTGNSLWVGVGAGIIMSVTAVLVGLLAGYRRGRVYEVLSFLTNIVLVIPGLPLMVVIAAYIHTTQEWPTALVIAVTGWPWGARVLRAQALTLAKRDYVMAAKLIGESDLHIVLFELLPNMISLVMSNFMFATLYAILAEAALQFLGIGNLNTVTWGTMLYWADNGQALLNGAWWWLVPPGFAIAILGSGFALLNFAIDEISNPRLRKQASQ